jgi:VCBS repeat-containing protein
MPSQRRYFQRDEFQRTTATERSLRRTTLEGLEQRLLLNSENPVGPASGLAIPAVESVSQLVSTPTLVDREPADWFTQPSGPLEACDESLSNPHDGAACWLPLPSTVAQTASQPLGPLHHSSQPQSGSGASGTGPGTSMTGATYCGAYTGGTGTTGSGDAGTGVNPNGFRYVTVPEGVEVPLVVAGLDTFPGSTPYAPTTNVDGLFGDGPWPIAEGALEFAIVSNGSVAPDAPRRLQMQNMQQLTADDVVYDFIGTRPRPTQNGVGGLSHTAFRSHFSWQDRYFVQIDYDLYGGSGGWCAVSDVLPLNVVIVAQWFDLWQYQFRVDWGDATSSLGEATLNGAQRWVIGGSHVYEWSRPNQPYRPLANIYTHSVNGWQFRGSRADWLEVQVPDAPRWIDGGTPQANVDGEVWLEAVLKDEDPLTLTYSYDVLIDWGDGSTSAATVSPAGIGTGFYALRGFHAYNQLGFYSGTIQATASDGSTILGTFDVEVNSLRPGAGPNTYVLLHDRPFSSNLLASLGSQLGLTVTLESGTSHGSLDLRADGVFTYMPDFRFVGEDQFVYRLWEDGIPSFPITITLQVINHAPVAEDDTWPVSPHRRFAGRVLLNDRDVDGDVLEASLVSLPTQGTLMWGTDGRFEYLPPPGYVGVDEFTYRASDGLSDSEVATVTLSVGNRLPEMPEDQNYSLVHDRSLTRNWPHIDPDGDVIRPFVRAHPRFGAVVFESTGTWTYTPQANYVGTDSFTYWIDDGFLQSQPSVVNLEITNQTPLGGSDTYVVSHDQKLQVSIPRGVLANDWDPDNDSLVVTLAQPVAHGRLELRPDGSFDYQPNPRFVGQDSFSYIASDGVEGTEPLLVLIDVQSHVPEARDTTIENWPHDQTLIDNLNRLVSDPDREELKFALVASPAVGTLVLQPAGDWAYSPPPGFVGGVAFDYRVTDGLGLSDTGSVAIQVVQTAPLGIATSHVTVSHGRTLVGSLLRQVTDVDRNETLTARLLSEPVHGKLAFNSDGSYRYQPYPGFVSQDESQWDRFTYQVSDGRNETIVMTQTIDVQNNRPNAVADEYFLAHNRVLSATAPGGAFQVADFDGISRQRAPRSNDFDSDRDSLTYYLVDPSTGQEITTTELGLQERLTWNSDGTFQFDPGTRSEYEVEFYYAATDGLASSLPARVLIHVQDTPPVANADTYWVMHNLQLQAVRSNIFLTADSQHVGSPVSNDVNREGDALTATLIDPQTGLPADWQTLDLPGQLQWNGDGTFIYQPELGFSGEITLAYRVSDGVHSSNVSSIVIYVLGQRGSFPSLAW